MNHFDAAEDIASETFEVALSTWPYSGIPENPVAWLYVVAKNKTKNYLQRDQLFKNKIEPGIKGNGSVDPEINIDLSETNIIDSQLQMLFAICDPVNSAADQIGLALRILCGFRAAEIASALLTNKEAVNKRLSRARQKLRASGKMPGELPDTAITARLPNVLDILYLLFNEGYYSESNEAILREELCLEAMRLMHLLIENVNTNQPTVNALFSLMCFHASRFAARRNQHQELVLYDEQDESRWNQQLIARGAYYFRESSNTGILSKYHIEAGIAYWHTQKADSCEKWQQILKLYNHLLQIAYSPIAALNRVFALSKATGTAAAISEAEKLQLTANPYYYLLLGELYRETQPDKARENFEKAIVFAKTDREKQLIGKKMPLAR